MTGLGDKPLYTGGLPGEPSGPWPTEPVRCPRCGSAETELDLVRPRFLLLAWLRASTCKACGFGFSARTRRGIATIVAVAYLAPLVVVAVVVAAVLLVR